MVELYAAGINDAAPVKIKMNPASEAADNGVKEYDAKVDGSRPGIPQTEEARRDWRELLLNTWFRRMHKRYLIIR